jgi:hypothetical protein
MTTDDQVRTMMVCRVKDDLASNWVVLERGENGWGHVAVTTALEAAMKAVTLAEGFDFTFTTKGIDSAIATYAETFEQLQALGPHSHAVILCPEGWPVQKRWATLHRVPITGAIVGTGWDGRFRPPALKAGVLAYFAKHQWRSFTAPKIQERHEPPHQQAHRPAHHRELLVRSGWAARQIAPEAFGPINRHYYPEVA